MEGEGTSARHARRPERQGGPAARRIGSQLRHIQLRFRSYPGHEIAQGANIPRRYRGPAGRTRGRLRGSERLGYTWILDAISTADPRSMPLL